MWNLKQNENCHFLSSLGAHDRDDPEFISTVSNIALNPKWKKGSGFGSNAYVASDTAVSTKNY